MTNADGNPIGTLEADGSITPPTAEQLAEDAMREGAGITRHGTSSREMALWWIGRTDEAEEVTASEHLSARWGRVLRRWAAKGATR